MSAHKEEALDEKRYHFRFGSTCVTGFSQVIHTSSFDSFDAFFAHLQEEWDKLWGQVFSADAAGDRGHREGRGRMLRQCSWLSRGLGALVRVAAVAPLWAGRQWCRCAAACVVALLSRPPTPHTSMLPAVLPAALPYLQPQVEGFPMPAALRMSQLLLAITEGLLLQWLMQQTWRGWTSAVRGLCSLAGVSGTLQQVRAGQLMGSAATAAPAP